LVPIRANRISAPTLRLFVAVCVLLGMLLAYNLVVGRAARTSQREGMLARLDRIPRQTDCIFLGNSLVEAGCDMEAFRSAWPRSQPPLSAINLALGATSPVEHYLILKRALRQPLHLKYLIYGFFDDQLNAAPEGGWSDLLGNRAFSYYFPDEAASFYAPGSRLKRWELEIVGQVPILSERSSFWGKVELFRRWLGGLGLPAQKTDRFGRAADFKALEAKDTQSFNRRCEAVLAGHAGFSAPVRDIIRLAQAHGARVILLEMPLPSGHRKLYYSSPDWLRLRAYLQHLARQAHADYLSASDWVKDDGDFADPMHLSEAGAKVFSRELAPAIARIGSSSGELVVQRQ
jgi:hypothetical protein